MGEILDERADGGFGDAVAGEAVGGFDADSGGGVVQSFLKFALRFD